MKGLVMKCKQCKQNEASIHIKDQGSFCLNCHNQIMAEVFGVEKGLGKRILERFSDDFLSGNAIQMSDGQYGINSVGSGRISSDQDLENMACLIIDGKEISIDDFGRALTVYEGFTIDFQIRDPSADLLEKDMVLQAVSINPDIIYRRFERTLSWFLEGNFLSHKETSSCMDALSENLNEFELLHRYGEKEVAEKLGQRIKKRLMTIENDDDNFPRDLIELINELLK